VLWVLLAVAIVLLALVALAVAVLRTWRGTRELTHQLRRATEALERASGDLPRGGVP
jgi:uncharacterized protein YoxC